MASSNIEITLVQFKNYLNKENVDLVWNYSIDSNIWTVRAIFRVGSGIEAEQKVISMEFYSSASFQEMERTLISLYKIVQDERAKVFVINTFDERDYPMGIRGIDELSERMNYYKAELARRGVSVRYARNEMNRTIDIEGLVEDDPDAQVLSVRVKFEEFQDSPKSFDYYFEYLYDRLTPARKRAEKAKMGKISKEANYVEKVEVKKVEVVITTRKLRFD